MDQNILNLLRANAPKTPPPDEVYVSRSRKARTKRRYLSPPINLILDATASEVTIAWEEPLIYQSISGYKVLADGVEIADVPHMPPLLSYVHTGLTPSTMYSYAVYAYNEYGGTSGMLEGTVSTNAGSMLEGTVSTTA
ncbi:fibronectin-like protein [Pinkberry virus LS07-2018-MD00]|jgi:hypothetical protein|nr:fibronectin-like protein [Pinkberry virus LS07-2018-MD00]